MSDPQKDAMIDVLEQLNNHHGLTPKSTWSGRKKKGRTRTWDGTFSPLKLARRIQMGKNWKSSTKHVKTECGFHMPPKEAKYKHGNKEMGIAVQSYYTWGGGTNRTNNVNSYWWNEDDNVPDGKGGRKAGTDRVVDVIHAHAHVQGNDTTHGPGFAQAVFEIVDAQFEEAAAKKIVTDLYADLGITKGRGRKIAGKPKTVEDYVKVAPDAADALRALIEGLS